MGLPSDRLAGCGALDLIWLFGCSLDHEVGNVLVDRSHAKKRFRVVSHRDALTRDVDK